MQIKKRSLVSMLFVFRPVIHSFFVMHPVMNGIITKTVFLLVLILLIGLLDPISVRAQSIYFVRAGATGNSNGSDWNNAYTSLPSTLIRGSTYYIAEGSYPGYTFDDPVSGTMLITIRKATSVDHGTDIGWHDSYGDEKAIFGPIVFTTSYWVFDGVTGGGPGSWKTGFGFEVYPSSNNANAITFSGALSNITIKHVDAHVYPADTARASMTNYYHVFKGTTGACSNITFSYVWFHNAFGCIFQLANQWTGPLTIEYSYFSQNRSTPAMHSAGIACHGANNVTVRYNIWEDIDGTGFIDGIEVGTMDYWYVYGNVFMHTGIYGSSVSGVIVTAYDSSNAIKNNHWRVYNNSIINVKGIAKMFWADPAGMDIIVQNNLFYGNRTDNSYTNYVFIQGTGVSYDYNWYSATAHPGAFIPGAHENSFYWGPNCQLSTDTTNYFVAWQSGDYRLNQATSSGLTLADPYNKDFLGNTRGTNGVWDRGAFEFPSNSPPGGPISPPTGLRIQ